MKPRKDQTEEQRIMRKFALMVHKLRKAKSANAKLRQTAKDIWRLHPQGYSSFDIFYKTLARVSE